MAKTVKIHLGLSVVCTVADDVDEQGLVDEFVRRTEIAIGNGMIESGPSVEIDEHSLCGTLIPLVTDPLEDFMHQRIEDGEMELEKIPERLVQYGLMEPADFLSEMTERMQAQ
jgi:hypothetical protein